MIAFYLIDAHRYWTNLESPPLVKCNKLRRVLMIILSLIGYRKYSRAYVDIRTMPFLASMLSQELVVRINEMNWIIKRNRLSVLSVWRSLSIIMARSLKCFMRISIRKSRSYAI